MPICETAICGVFVCVVSVCALYIAIFRVSFLRNDSQCMPEAGCRKEEMEQMKDGGRMKEEDIICW